MRSKATFPFIFALASCLTLSGAEPIAPRVQLRFVSLSQTITGAGLATADGKATPVFITADSLSSPVSHPHGRLRLVSTLAAASPVKKTGEPVRREDIPPETPGFRKKKPGEPTGKVKTGNRELGAIDLPAGDHQRFIIIVHPGKGSGLTAIPDRLGFFPPGSDRYVNLSASPVIIDLPAGRQTLPPNGSIVLRPGAANRHQYQLKLLTKSGNEEHLFFSAFTPHDNGLRNLRILLPGGSEGDGIELKTISDGLAAEDNYR
jgi:hypothetical protein